MKRCIPIWDLETAASSNSGLHWTRAEVQEAWAYIERLRAALQQIFDECSWSNEHSDGYWASIKSEKIARIALAGPAE